MQMGHCHVWPNVMLIFCWQKSQLGGGHTFLFHLYIDHSIDALASRFYCRISSSGMIKNGDIINSHEFLFIFKYKSLIFIVMDQAFGVNSRLLSGSLAIVKSAIDVLTLLS